LTWVTDRIAVAYPNILFRGTWKRAGHDKFAKVISIEYGPTLWITKGMFPVRSQASCHTMSWLRQKWYRFQNDTYGPKLYMTTFTFKTVIDAHRVLWITLSVLIPDTIEADRTKQKSTPWLLLHQFKIHRNTSTWGYVWLEVKKFWWKLFATLTIN